jgi:hypothetical protein
MKVRQYYIHTHLHKIAFLEANILFSYIFERNHNNIKLDTNKKILLNFH